MSDQIDIQQLEALITRDEVWQKIQVALRATEQKLAVSKRKWMTQPLDLSIYGDDLPDNLKSSRVTIFKPKASAKVERHPNAMQIVRVMTGRCEIHTRPGDKWQSHPKAADAEALADRWSVVAPNVWHYPNQVDGNGWSVLAFHTVPADKLIDERD